MWKIVLVLCVIVFSTLADYLLLFLCRQGGVFVLPNILFVLIFLLMPFFVLNATLFLVKKIAGTDDFSLIRDSAVYYFSIMFSLAPVFYLSAFLRLHIPFILLALPVALFACAIRELFYSRRILFDLIIFLLFCANIPLVYVIIIKLFYRPV